MQPDDLELYRGNIIMILSKPFEGWWEGEIIEGRARGMRGLFPSNYVQIEEDGKIEEIGDENTTEPEAIASPSVFNPLSMSDTYARRMQHARRF